MLGPLCILPLPGFPVDSFYWYKIASIGLFFFKVNKTWNVSNRNNNESKLIRVILANPCLLGSAIQAQIPFKEIKIGLVHHNLKTFLKPIGYFFGGKEIRDACIMKNEGLMVISGKHSGKLD